MDVFGEIRGPASGGSSDGRPRFPELPILNPGEVPAPVAAPARGQREKYGALFYLGIAGLVVLLALIGWFGHGLWTNRDIWADVYVLNDAKRLQDDRLDAALRLSRNPRFDDGARMEMALRKDLPPLARYLLAESVSTDLVAHDPRSYALTVARSEGWPIWLRLLLARRLAYGAGRGYAIPREALDELRRQSDPIVRLWATYALAVLPRPGPDPAMAAELEESAKHPGPTGELAAGYDLRLVYWEDDSRVPNSASNLVIVGIDTDGLLHIRIFDASSNKVTDTDETKLPATQAGAISNLKQQLPGLLPPHVLTRAEKNLLVAEATSIVGQTLAARLLDALRATGEERERLLDEATEWLRHHHPQAADIWRGWEVRDYGVVRTMVR